MSRSSWYDLHSWINELFFLKLSSVPSYLQLQIIILPQCWPVCLILFLQHSSISSPFSNHPSSTMLASLSHSFSSSLLLQVISSFKSCIFDYVGQCVLFFFPFLLCYKSSPASIHLPSTMLASVSHFFTALLCFISSFRSFTFNNVGQLVSHFLQLSSATSHL